MRGGGLTDIAKYLYETFGIRFNEQQEKAVRTGSRHTLLLAVPGSGKTTVLVSRIAHLILNSKVMPDQILTLTFSRESARDMKRRFDQLFGSLQVGNPRFSTIHSFCHTVLTTYAQQYRRKFPTLIADSSAKVSKAQLLRQLYAESHTDYLADDVLESLSNNISLAKNLMYGKKEIFQMDTSVDDFPDLMERYEAAKKQHALMDYDDMLSYAYAILRQLPELLGFFQKKYPYIHVDEAQDTSKIQYAILSLFSESAHTFFVGDEDQCIYTFRGAYPQGLLEFDREFPGAAVLKLEQNYRSNSDIVERADSFIQMNRERYAKAMFCENEQVGSILYQELEDYGKQAQALIELIQQKPTGESLAVLYRNNESAIPLLDALRRNGIQYYTKEHNLRFFTSFAVRDIMAYFTLSYEPCNLSAFEQIYYKSMCSKNILIFVKQNITSYTSVFEAAANCPGIPAFQLKKLLSYHRELLTLAQKRPFSAINTIETRLGYGEFLNKQAKGSLNPVNATLKLSILKTVARNYQTIEEFARSLVDLEQSMSVQNSDAHSLREQAEITLSSVHSSKGLEFDTVVLVDFIDGILPDHTAADAMDDGRAAGMESEARLFYVAVTRARSKLVIFTSPFCNDEYVLRSRFVTRMMQEKPEALRKPEFLHADIPLKGKRVWHKFFGEGMAASDCVQDMVQIYFPKYGTKTVSYSTCLENETMKILQ